MSAGMGEGDETGGSKAVRNSLIAGTGCGCLLSPVALVCTAIVVMIFGGFGVLLAPLIALILLFGGGNGSNSSHQEVANQMVGVLQGNGKGRLDNTTVPADLLDPIKRAGQQCPAIGPIVIASQIEKESGFDASLKGPNGELGLSQLPPDIFEKYGKDDDKNDKTSALDAEDSILAQGRYLCDLAKQGQQMIDNAELREQDGDEGALRSSLDLALAGYAVGMDAVRAAKGVPQTNEALGYILSIRAQFAKYQGIAAPPAGATPGVTPEPSDPASPGTAAPTTTTPTA
ncbi:transglycosylase SLT domain-containing protein [Streptomyces sp. NPDC091387]|uniref:transglycosylase SLT domain-containing protein n=1 Tax=Streptomyces sp. NPDC091387 TaxID=3365998 RepID=UPI0037F3961C